MLGDMYRFGQGVAEDLEEAVKHYQTGAEQGANYVHVQILCTMYIVIDTQSRRTTVLNLIQRMEKK